MFRYSHLHCCWSVLQYAVMCRNATLLLASCMYVLCSIFPSVLAFQGKATGTSVVPIYRDARAVRMGVVVKWRARGRRDHELPCLITGGCGAFSFFFLLFSQLPIYPCTCRPNWTILSFRDRRAAASASQQQQQSGRGGTIKKRKACEKAHKLS